jgi:hypothetical protein
VSKTIGIYVLLPKYLLRFVGYFAAGSSPPNSALGTWPGTELKRWLFRSDASPGH